MRKKCNQRLWISKFSFPKWTQLVNKLRLWVAMTAKLEAKKSRQARRCSPVKNRIAVKPNPNLSASLIWTTPMVELTKIVLEPQIWAQLATKDTILWHWGMPILLLTNRAEMEGQLFLDKLEYSIGKLSSKIDDGWGWAQVWPLSDKVITVRHLKRSVFLKIKIYRYRQNPQQITKQRRFLKTLRRATNLLRFRKVFWMIRKVSTWAIVCQIANQTL